MKQSGMVKTLQKQRAARDSFVRHHTQVYILDMVTLALGRMGWGEKRLRDFDQKLTEASQEYAKLILDDVKEDKEIIYSKACLDRELKQYTGSLFVPYEKRYGG